MKKKRKINMKKLFVSVPTVGRTDAEIRKSIEKMHKIAELYEGEELELIDNNVEETPSIRCRWTIWYLGESIKKLADADVFIGIEESLDWDRCYIEEEVARRYYIKRIKVPARDVIDNYYEYIGSTYEPETLISNEKEQSN